MKKKTILKIVAIAAVAILLITAVIAVIYREKNTYGTESAKYAETQLTAGSGMRNSAVYSADMVSEEEADYEQEAELSDERKIVRTYGMTVRTSSFEESRAQVYALLSSNGGYAEGVSEWGDEGSRRASFTLRVPTERVSEFLSGLEGTGRVTDRHESAEDKTLTYRDNAARLDTLYQKRERLNALLSQAQSVSDIIEIESALADTQYSIDRYEGYQRGIDHDVDFTLVTITLYEETPKEIAAEKRPLWERMKAGFVASIEGCRAFAEGLVVVLTMMLPVVIPVGIIILIVIRLVKHRRKSK